MEPAYAYPTKSMHTLRSWGARDCCRLYILWVLCRWWSTRWNLLQNMVMKRSPLKRHHVENLHTSACQHLPRRTAYTSWSIAQRDSRSDKRSASDPFLWQALMPKCFVVAAQKSAPMLTAALSGQSSHRRIFLFGGPPRRSGGRAFPFFRLRSSSLSSSSLRSRSSLHHPSRARCQHTHATVRPMLPLHNSCRPLAGCA